MFTGIISAVGHIINITPQTMGSNIVINTGRLDLSDVKIGDSIAVNGVCLTVTELKNNNFVADISFETLQKTSLGQLTIGTKINLEKALTPTDRLGGHLVSGHIDGIGIIISKKSTGNSVIFGIKAPDDLAKYIAKKGSITVDGVSLTVNIVNGCDFYLTIVPHTLTATIINIYQIGTKVNLEIDLLARYLERLMQGDDAKKPDPMGQNFLRQHGYL